MQRNELLEKLTIVSSALSNKDLIPVLSHFWFDGKTVTAFNDQIAISTTCKTQFKGAVPGEVLRSLLKNSKAKTVELIPEDDKLTVKAASSKIKLALLPQDSFAGIFDMPELDDDTQLHINTDKLVNALQNCMRSVGTDASLPDQLGITLVPQGKNALSFYSTNDVTLSTSIVGLKKKSKVPTGVILATPFCQQILSLAPTSKVCKLYLTAEYALFKADDVMMYGRTIHSDNPVPFGSVLKDHLPDNYAVKFIPIPSKMRLILERALIIASLSVENRATSISIKDGKMKFISKSEQGEIVDYVDVGSHHGDVTVSLDPKLLRNGYGYFDSILLQKKSAIMKKGDDLYMIAAVGGK